MMNPALLAALCGFLYRELRAIEGRSDRTRPVDLGYYLRHNWVVVAGNAVGTVGLWMALPELMGLQREVLQDEYPILTGLAVGLMGAWAVRRLQQLVKQRVNIALGDRHEQ